MEHKLVISNKSIATTICIHGNMSRDFFPNMASWNVWYIHSLCHSWKLLYKNANKVFFETAAPIFHNVGFGGCLQKCFVVSFTVLLQVPQKFTRICCIKAFLRDNLPHSTPKLERLGDYLIICAICFTLSVGNHLPQSQQTFLAIAYKFAPSLSKELSYIRSFQSADTRYNVVSMVIITMLK